MFQVFKHFGEQERTEIDSLKLISTLKPIYNTIFVQQFVQSWCSLFPPWLRFSKNSTLYLSVSVFASLFLPLSLSFSFRNQSSSFSDSLIHIVIFSPFLSWPLLFVINYVSSLFIVSYYKSIQFSVIVAACVLVLNSIILFLSPFFVSLIVPFYNTISFHGLSRVSNILDVKTEV